MNNAELVNYRLNEIHNDIQEALKLLKEQNGRINNNAVEIIRQRGHVDREVERINGRVRNAQIGSGVYTTIAGIAAIFGIKF